jgi:hypothetical protein
VEILGFLHGAERLVHLLFATPYHIDREVRSSSAPEA